MGGCRPDSFESLGTIARNREARVESQKQMSLAACGRDDVVRRPCPAKFQTRISRNKNGERFQAEEFKFQEEL